MGFEFLIVLVNTGFIKEIAHPLSLSRIYVGPNVHVSLAKGARKPIYNPFPVSADWRLNGGRVKLAFWQMTGFPCLHSFGTEFMSLYSPLCTHRGRTVAQRGSASDRYHLDLKIRGFGDLPDF